MKLSSEFKRFCLILFAGMFIFSSMGCSASSTGGPQGYSISSDVRTTLDRTIVPDPTPTGSPTINITEISKYKQAGYSTWSYKQGLPLTRMTLTGDNSVESATNTARLLRFFTFTDIHITDEESPAQMIYMGYTLAISSAYSGVMLYTTQVLDAAVQTINALHKKDSFDCGLSLGDTCNSSDYIETKWYIDVLDGKIINPASCPGIIEDPVPGPNNDYQDRYKAAGIDKSIQWYQVMGNHDHFWIGSYPITDYLRAIYTGLNILNNSLANSPPSPDNKGYYMGALDGRTVYGDIIGAGPTANFPTPPQVLAANPDRRAITRNEWISEFFNSTSNPIGHGFSRSSIDSGFTCYSFFPKSDIPIKVIVLDDTQREDDANYGGYGHATVDKERYDWLVNQLNEGQAAGQLMIIACHCPMGVGEPSTSPVSWSPGAYVTEANFIAKLHTYPNLILLIAGHRHLNTITAQNSPDPAHPELGFWEVETSSLRDFPQQFRTFDILRNSDNTISIIAVDVDTAAAEGSLAAISRSYAVAAQQFDNNNLGNQPSGSYNGELIKQLTPEMQLKLANLGTPITKKHGN